MELSKRKITNKEEKLLEFLINKSLQIFPNNWKEDLLVASMDDGEMGSIYLFPKLEYEKERTFGKQISEIQFSDLDGVEVIVSLNIDSEGHLFELDIWKANYDKLIQLPDFSNFSYD